MMNEELTIISNYIISGFADHGCRIDCRQGDASFTHTHVYHPLQQITRDADTNIVPVINIFTFYDSTELFLYYPSRLDDPQATHTMHKFEYFNPGFPNNLLEMGKIHYDQITKNWEKVWQDGNNNPTWNSQT